MTVSINDTAEFTCVIVGSGCAWKRNGAIIDEVKAIIDIGFMSLPNTTYKQCILRIVVNSTDNATNITCTAIARKPVDTMVTSSPALLLVQEAPKIDLPIVPCK